MTEKSVCAINPTPRCTTHNLVTILTQLYRYFFRNRQLLHVVMQPTLTTPWPLTFTFWEGAMATKLLEASRAL